MNDVLAYTFLLDSLNVLGWLDLESVHRLCFPSLQHLTVQRKLKVWVDGQRLMTRVVARRIHGTTQRIGKFYGTTTAPQPRSLRWQHAVAHLTHRLIRHGSIGTLGVLPIDKTTYLIPHHTMRNQRGFPHWSTLPTLSGPRWLLIPHDESATRDYHYQASHRYRTHADADPRATPVFIGAMPQIRPTAQVWCYHWKTIYLFDPMDDRWSVMTRKGSRRSDLDHILCESSI